MKKILKIFAVIIALISPIVVFGAPPYTFTNTLQPSTSLMDVGSTTLSAYRNIVAQIFTATSTRASIFPYASTTAISAGTICFTGDICRTTWPTSGASPDWNKQFNYNVLSLTPTTTIPVWFKDQVFASSSAIFAGDVTSNRFIATSTSVASSFPYASSTVISTTGNAYFITQPTGGYVGLGSTSPYSVLSISNTRLTPANTPLLTIASTTNGTATTTFLTLLANGNTGIRNTNPGSFLDIGSVATTFGDALPTYRASVNDQSSGAGAGLLVSNSGTVSATSSIVFKSPTTGDTRPFSSGAITSGFTTTGYSGSYLKLGSASAANTYSNELTIANGRVGIGTSSPESLLDVDGLATFGVESASSAQVKVKGGQFGGPMFTLARTLGAVIQFSWALGGGGLSFTDDTNGFTVFNLYGDASSNDVYLGSRGKTTNDSARPSLISGQTYNVASSDISAGNLSIQGGLGQGAGTPGDILFKTGTILGSGTTIQTGATRMVIKNNTGNVGIGSTSPYAKLSVVGEVVMSSFNATSTTATSTIAGALKYGRSGVVTLVAGVATVTVPLDSNSVVFLTVQNCGGSCGQVSVNSRTSSSFDIESTSIVDTSDVGWMVIQK